MSITRSRQTISKYNGYNEDPDHKSDLFKYGYLGQFTTHKTPTYQIGSDTVNGNFYSQAWILNSWDFDTLVDFRAFSYNPLICKLYQLLL